jgi:hypothetical protein
MNIWSPGGVGREQGGGPRPAMAAGIDVCLRGGT